MRRQRGGTSMRSLLSGVGVALAVVCAASPAHGQKATEQYIPIGQSPGLSGKQTSIAEIAQVNLAGRTITIADSAGPRNVRITDSTRIWLDRSKLKQSNLSGSLADLQPGRRVEVKYLDLERRDAAEWVKVEVTQQ